MKTIYQCEICGNKSSDKEEIKGCEAQGVFDGSFYIPGTMFEYHHYGFVGIFAIPKNYPKPSCDNPHIGNLLLWACRDNGSGDNLEELCSGDLVHTGKEGFEEWSKQHYITPKYRKSPALKRMVEGLWKKGITPRYYNKSGKLCIIRRKNVHFIITGEKKKVNNKKRQENLE